MNENNFDSTNNNDFESNLEGVPASSDANESSVSVDQPSYSDDSTNIPNWQFAQGQSGETYAQGSQSEQSAQHVQNQQNAQYVQNPQYAQGEHEQNTQDTQSFQSAQTNQTSQYNAIPVQPTQPKPKKAKQGSGTKPFVWGIVGVLAGAVIVLGSLFVTGSFGGSNAYSGQSSNGTVNINASGNDTTISQAVAAKVLPSIVSIDVYTQQSSTYGIFSGSTKDSSTESQSSLGSGVIMSQDGYILTNYHVISGGSKYIVHFDDDSTAEAKVVGSDESSDLAVLKVDKTGLTPIEVADSTDVAVGDWVMTAGSPFGLTKSVSAGIVSALYRNETLENSYGSSFYVNMIQVDAGVNPGNSGGALVNSEGKLIGICVMTASYSGDFAGIGFAIPSNYANKTYNSIKNTGKAEHSYLGVSVGTVDASTKSYYGTSADSGAYVGSVVSGGPAEKAGIQKGDVIVSIDGEAVTTSSELIIDVRSKEIGDKVKLEVVRNGQTITIEAELGSDAQNSDNES